GTREPDERGPGPLAVAAPEAGAACAVEGGHPRDLYQRGGLPGRGRLISSAFVPADPSRRIRRGEMGRECALDEQAFMSAALDMARRGLAAGEVPIGACLVQDGAVVATAHNAVGAGPDPTAHAEIVLIREACRRLRTTALGGAVLYVTVEP